MQYHWISLQGCQKQTKCWKLNQLLVAMFPSNFPSVSQLDLTHIWHSFDKHSDLESKDSLHCQCNDGSHAASYALWDVSNKILNQYDINLNPCQVVWYNPWWIVVINEFWHRLSLVAKALNQLSVTCLTVWSKTTVLDGHKGFHISHFFHDN